MRRPLGQFLAVVAGAGFLVAAGFAGHSLAQDDQVELAIGQSRSGATSRELQAQATAEPPKTDDRHELAIFYHKRGMASHRLGNYSRAIEDLRLALENNQPNRPTPGEWGHRWRIQNDLANAYGERGDRFAEIDVWKEAAREYPESDLFVYHFAQLRLMRAYSVLGRWAEADHARDQAERTLPRLKETRAWNTQGNNALDNHNRDTAGVFSRQGNHQEAERRYRASLEWAGKYADATERAHGTADQRNRIAVGNLRIAKTNLADNLSTRGKFGEAELFARSGLQDSLAVYGFNTTVTGSALAVVGWTRFQQGDITGAEKYYRYALAAVEGSGVAPHSTTLAARRAALANVMIVQGRWDEALRLFDDRDRGLRSDAAQFKRIGSNHVGWAYALHKTGQSQGAGQMVGRMVAARVKHPVPDQWAIAQVRGVAGMALAATGNVADALREFQQSLPELMRRDQDDATTENTGYWRTFWQRAILESYLDLLANLQSAGASVPGLDLMEESFRIADIARGSTVQEAITATAARAQLPDRSLAELARKEQDTLNRIIALNQLLGRLASAPEKDRLSKVIAEIRSEIERLRNEHAAMRADIRKRFPDYAELVDPRPVGIADVRKALAPGEALVAIYLGDVQSYVWTMGIAGKAVFRVVPVKREEVESDVRELRKATDFGDGNPSRLPPFDLARAYKLYRAFFEPDEQLWKDAQLLNVVSHGALGQLPLGLLVTSTPPAAGESAYRDAPWLIRKVAISQLPAAAALTALRRSPAGNARRQSFIGFGDPLFTAGASASGSVVRSLVVRRVADRTEEQLKGATRGGRPDEQGSGSATLVLSRAFTLLSTLPDTSQELREIASVLKADPDRDIFVGRQATEKNVKQAALQNHRVVAFATHGIAPGEIAGLDQPALVLSNPALTGDTDNDGFLTMEEVLALKLDADWVVLSACNTASADGRGSEAVSGLGRAFFYAGARSLLVSNWAVETTSARLLTTELFKRQAVNPQLTRAEALRQSMLDLMGKKAPGGFSYAHPAFWAPFSLVGDGGR